jgi:uncharacterized membrane protein YciS (DUF1049 family)
MASPAERLARYHFTSVGLLLLLIQMAVVVICLIVLAVGLGARNEMLLQLMAVGIIPIAAILGLLGFAGKICCFAAPGGWSANLLLGTSIFADIATIPAQIVELPSFVKNSVQIVSLAAFLLYLFVLARVLESDKCSRTVRGALVSGVIGLVVMTYAATRGPAEDTQRIIAAVIGFGAVLYGILLYLRSMVYLREAIKGLESAPRSQPEYADAETDD